MIDTNRLCREGFIEDQAQPRILETSKEDHVVLDRIDATGVAFQVMNHMLDRANAKWGHLIEPDVRFHCNLVVRKIGGKCVAIAEGCKTIHVNERYLTNADDQWDVLTETIAHEVAHIVFVEMFNSAGFRANLTRQQFGKLFGRKRITWHGAFWKFLFCELANLTKVNNRFFGQITR